MGDDSGRLCWLFHDACRDETLGLLNVRIAPLDAPLCTSNGRIRLLPCILLGGGISSSEKRGAVSGEEARLDCTLLDVVDAVSEIVSLDDAGRFLLMRCSSCGSMVSMLMFSQPFWILTLASASRSWRARVICEEMTEGKYDMQPFLEYRRQVLPSIPALSSTPSQQPLPLPAYRELVPP